MKRFPLRGALALASVVGAVAGPLTGAPAAHAVLPAGQVAVAAAGSDTTEKVMGELAGAFDNSSVTIGGSPTTVRTYNIPAFSNNPYTVPGDASCTDVTWTKDPTAPASPSAPTKGIAPFGSGRGRDYLAAENGGTGPGSPAGTDFGCVDVARSSSGPRTVATGDKLSFEYYAYAMDAVSWASTSLKAPATLTRQQITDIYDCVVTNWDQVGGTSGPIKRYFPQAGSGTRAFFISDVLVNKASTYVPPSAGTGSCTSDPVLIEENQGKTIADADIDKAILPYSAGVWAYQESNRINPTLDLRKGARLGGITTTGTPVIYGTPLAWSGSDRVYQLDTATVVNENNIKLNNANPAYPGIRYVFNVLDNAGNRPGYQGGFGLYGFSNTAGGFKSPLCSNSPAASDSRGQIAFAAILTYGFAPLSTSDVGGHNVAGSTCRLYNVTS